MSAEISGFGLPLTTVSIIIGSILGFAALLTIIWNFSKKITTMELSLAAQDKKHVEDMKAIEIKMEQSKTERKDDIRDSLQNQTNKFEMIQKQVDSVKSDVKDISSRVTQNDQKARHADEQIKEIKDLLFGHFTEWNRRTENNIEQLRREFIQMFTAFHGHHSKNE